MAYADQQMSGNRIVAIIIVALIHIALGYALITGLAYNAVQQVVERVTTIDIEEPPPPEEEPAAAGERARHAAAAGRSAAADQYRAGTASDPDADDDPAAGTAAAGHSAAGTPAPPPCRPRPAALRRVVRLAGHVGSRAITLSRRARRYRG